MACNKRLTLDMVKSVLNEPGLLFLVGVLALVAGLAIVICHNIWSVGALPVVVTCVGWVSVIKAALFLFLTPQAASGLFLQTMGFERFYYLYVAFASLLGLYLTVASFGQGTSGSETGPAVTTSTR